MLYDSDHEETWPPPHCETDWDHRGGPSVDCNGALPVWWGERDC